MPSPIGHSLMGACLYNDGSPIRRRRWPLFALFVFLANAPDLDFLPGVLRGNPELFHRQVTHSVFFAMLCAGAVYAAMRLLRRPYAGRLARVTLIGLFSHIVLDYFCGTPFDGPAVLWPLSDVHVVAPIRLFPELYLDRLVAWNNLRTLLIEVSVLMIVMQVTAFARAFRTFARHPGLRRRAAERAKPAGLEVETQ